MAGAPLGLSARAGGEAYFGVTCGLPPGVPGGGMTGMLLLPSEGGETTPASGVGGGFSTPPE